jgi:hypothetical protein
MIYVAQLPDKRLDALIQNAERLRRTSEEISTKCRRGKTIADTGRKWLGHNVDDAEDFLKQQTEGLLRLGAYFVRGGSIGRAMGREITERRAGPPGRCVAL